MVFSSLNFIFIFLPLFLFAYYVTPAAFRNSTLFAGSILFYAVGVIKQPYALFLLMVLTYLNYVFGIRLYQIHNPRKKRLFLTKVIFFDFLWLFLFKCRPADGLRHGFGHSPRWNQFLYVPADCISF